MSLQDLVREAFAPGSVLSRSVQEFSPRSGQTQMALAVARVIEDGGVLVVEAGTGVGKTFSYLVPALMSGERLLLSTATKTLQDQLFSRDLPRLTQALGRPIKLALLKGRSSYVCLHRLGLARHELDTTQPATTRALARIEQWSQTTRTGDLSELPGLDERSPLIPIVSSTRDNCLGSQCPSHKACHVNLARREALGADVVVINHHLFFADMAVRESGMAELLPSVRTVIFDEAHQLNETGVQFLGQHFSTSQVQEFARDVLGTGLQLARGLVPWQALATALDKASRDLRLSVGRTAGQARWRWVEAAPDGVDEVLWREALGALQKAAAALREGLQTVLETAPDFVRLHERAQTLLKQLSFFEAPCADGSVRWLDVGHQLRLVESPLDIAQAVQEKLLMPGAVADTAAAVGERRAWIFTSATLGHDPQLRWFTEPCGLQGAEVLRVDSPFDYPAQAAVYVPRDFPKPGEPRHSEEVAALSARSARVLGGRTLVLTTTLRALRTISEALQREFDGSGTLEVLVQGQGSKRELMERFRRGDEEGLGCILVASASFWEGVDVPGDALQLVVIDKLPFPPPNDPLVEARTRRLETQGRSAFNDYFVPEATVALKQGAGRLIRRETDQGILLLCDTRLLAMGYGRRMLAALPPMRQLPSAQALEAELAAITRISTTTRAQFPESC